MARPLALLLALSLCGCTSTEETPPPPARPIDETIEIAARPAPTIAVSDAGAEPRRLLRLHPAAGADERFEMSVGMSMAMQQGGNPLPSVAIPTTVTRMRSTIESVQHGVFTVAQSVEAVELVPQATTPPAVTQQMHAAVDPLVHYRATVRMDDRGAVLGGKVVVPGDLPAMVRPQMVQLAQNTGQLAVPLPPEPVGVGAHWSATTDVDQNGMKLRQIGEYTLRAMAEEHLVIDAAIRQELTEPEIQVPGMLGTTAKVGDFRSSGSSTIELDLDHLAPAHVGMTMNLHMSLEMTVLGQHQRTEMDMGIDMTLKRTDG